VSDPLLDRESIVEAFRKGTLRCGFGPVGTHAAEAQVVGRRPEIVGADRQDLRHG
jgi:hypothetical protein